MSDAGLSELEWFRSLDWGYINPGCCLWWCCLPDRRYFIRHELKFSHWTVKRVKKEIQDITLDHDIRYVRYTVADPAVKGARGDEMGETIQESFQRGPIHIPLQLGDNNRKGGWQRIREMLDLREDGQPTLIIHSDCSYLIRSLSQAVSSKNDPEDIDTHSDDHALDALRYGAMSRPSPTKVISTSSQRTFKAKQQLIARYQRRMSIR